MRNKAPHPTYRTNSGQYKIKNWSEYNQGLKRRGSLEIWIGRDIESQWYYSGEKKRGGQFKYSHVCIEMACILREVYHLPYRQLEGFIGSIVARLGWDVKVPDYTVINRRRKRLDVKLKDFRSNGKDRIYLVVDSTGLKVYGEGEWKVRQHGWSKYRTWMKIHLAIDEATSMIEGCATTTNSVDDASMIVPLLEQISGKIKKMAGDGAYDKRKVYEPLFQRKIKPIIPPRKGARIQKHGKRPGKALPRDQNIRAIRKWGRKRWKQKIQYHRRSIAENIMYRFKLIFGEGLNSRTIHQQQVEVLLKCKILNRMTQLARPDSFPIKKIG